FGTLCLVRAASVLRSAAADAVCPSRRTRRVRRPRRATGGGALGTAAGRRAAARRPCAVSHRSAGCRRRNRCMPLTPSAEDGVVRFDFGRGVTLEVRGPRGVRHHFAAEYGAMRSDGATPMTVVSFRGAADEEQERHKTVRWRVELGDPGEEPLTARLQVGGRPRSFALSLLQGYVVEPLLA